MGYSQRVFDGFCIEHNTSPLGGGHTKIFHEDDSWYSVTIYHPSNFRKEVEISWPSFGAVSVDTAYRYAELLNFASNMASHLNHELRAHHEVA